MGLVNIPVVTVLSLLAGLEQVGIRREDLPPLALPEQPETSDAVVPLEMWRELAGAASVLSGDPALAIHVGLSVPMGRMGIIDYLAGSSADVRSGLTSLADHFAAVSTAIWLDLVEAEDGSGWLYIRPVASFEADPGILFGLEFALGVITSRFRKLSASPLQFGRVGLTRAEDPAFERRMGLPVTFEMQSIGLYADRAALDTRLTSSNPGLHATLKQVASDLQLGDRQPALTLAVRARLRDLLVRGCADASTVARSMGVSERTLSRRLAELGTTFRDVLDSFRAEESERLLLAGDRSMAEISAALGYNDQSAWTKAFRRWNGLTPKSWLKQSIGA